MTCGAKNEDRGRLCGLRPKPLPGYTLESIDDEIIVFHPAGDQLVHCNASAALIWQLCDGTRTVAEIAELLAGAYPDAKATMLDDVTASVETLLDKGVLEAVCAD